jgi:hypothetical protein
MGDMSRLLRHSRGGGICAGWSGVVDEGNEAVGQA